MIQSLSLLGPVIKMYVVVVVITWAINRIFVADSFDSERGEATHHKGAAPSVLFTIEFPAQACQIHHYSFR